MCEDVMMTRVRLAAVTPTLVFLAANVCSAHLDATNKFCIFAVNGVFFFFLVFQLIWVIADDPTLCRLRARLPSGDVLKSKLIPSADPSVWACVSAHVPCSWASLLSAISGLLRSEVLHSGSSIIIYKWLFPLPNEWTSLLAVGRHLEAFVSLLTVSLLGLLQQTWLASQCPARCRCSGGDKRLGMCRRERGQSAAMARSSVRPGSTFSPSSAMHICLLAGLLASHTLATDGKNNTGCRSVKKKNWLHTFIVQEINN